MSQIFTAAAQSCTAPRATSENLIVRVLAALNMGRSRRALANLDPHLLEDIGVSHDEACAEANLSSWNAPTFWVK